MVQNFVNNLLRRNQQPEDVQIQPIQLDNNGNYDPVASAALGLKIRQDATPMTIRDRLFGREMTQDYQKFNPETNQAEMATLRSNKSGLINDFMGGLRENYNEGLQAENLMPNQNKGWATRLGEGFGTALRFADKPIGRFALASGLSALTGEANPLAEGVTAYVGRQQNQTADKVYRQALVKMGYDQNEIDSIRGNFTDDIFRSFVLQKQLEDNAEWRKRNIEAQQEQNKIMNQYRQDQLTYQKNRDKVEDYFKSLGLSIQQSKIAADNYYRDQELELKRTKETPEERKAKVKFKQAQNTINMINKAKETAKNNSKAFGLVQGVLGADVINRLDKGGTKARSVVNSVSAEYKKYLTGANMSDKERADYEKFLPSPRDNAEIIQNKLNAMIDVISAREGIDTAGNADPLGVL